MSEHDIFLDESKTKGRAYLGDINDPEAEMTYSRAGEELIIIDHTDVGEHLQGQGVGRQLLKAIVEMARDRGIKILPLCPYAASVFKKDLSIQDVLRK